MIFHWPHAMLPEVRLAGRFVLADRRFATTYLGRAHALHLHDYGGRMRLAGEVVALEPGDVTISPAGWPSAYDLDHPGRHWCIHFAGSGAGLKLPVHFKLGDGATPVRERMAHIARLSARDDRIAEAGAAIALQELLLWLAERASPPRRASAPERAAEIIDRRFDEPLTIAAIASEVGKSQTHLGRQFRRHHGVTMAHRLMQRRAVHARYLLESTDLPIWRVAERVGIPDAQHFNKTVRRMLGGSPSAVRAAAAGAGGVVDPDR